MQKKNLSDNKKGTNLLIAQSIKNLGTTWKSFVKIMCGCSVAPPYMK